jgi:pterin-4a-carbinolamine dehydratase
MADFADRKCEPCEGGAQAGEAMRQLHDDWNLGADGKSISRTFDFPAFSRTIAFTNAVAWIATVEGHHPEMTVSYGRCVVSYKTTAIDGLSDNDFIAPDMVEFKDIEAAAERLAPVAVETPLLRSPALDEIAGGTVWIKPENLQVTGSFKFRGAYNMMSQLSPEDAKRGVVAFSSGNHAQAVAACGGMLGIETTIVMPEDAPTVKIENTRRLGGHAQAWRQNGPLRSLFRGSGSDSAGDCGRNRQHRRACFRSRTHHCRAGHRRARIDAAMPGAWRDARPGIGQLQRRRPDCRHVAGDKDPVAGNECLPGRTGGLR